MESHRAKTFKDGNRAIMTAIKHDVFQAIADPTRRHVLQLLSKEELSIAAISAHFPISRTAVAKHLHILSDANLVKSHRKGRENIYHINPEPLTEVSQWLHYYEQFWNNKLTKLKFIVENDREE